MKHAWGRRTVCRVRLLSELPEQRGPRGLPEGCAFLQPSPHVRRLRTGIPAAAVRDVLVRPPTRRWWGRGAAGPEDEPESGAAPARRKSAAPEVDEFLAGLLALLRPPAAALLNQLHWPCPLYPYQQAGVAFLYERREALLADDMGLGKTVQTLAALNLLLASRQIADALIVAPASLVHYWSEQIRTWLPQLAGAHTVIRGAPGKRRRQWRAATPLKVVGYETLRADQEAGRVPPAWIGVVVLDEAQRIKNAETGLAFACKALRRDRSWALSGTPVENRVEDLVSILQFVTGERWLELAAGPALRARQRELQLRRRKEDVLADLPPKTIVEVALELTPEQRSTYTELEKNGRLELRRLGRELTVKHVLALLTRLKQVCNFCPNTGRSAKLEFIHERLTEVLENDRRALLFSQFTDASFGLRRLRAELGDRAVGLFHGGMSPNERETAVRAFKRGEVPVLALSLRAGSLGLNLQEASYVFHFDRWWNPAVERQAEDRAHRIGQSLPVTVYRLTSIGTVEERARALLREKEALFEEIVEGAPPPDTPSVTVAELFALLDLEPPRGGNERSEGGGSGEVGSEGPDR